MNAEKGFIIFLVKEESVVEGWGRIRQAEKTYNTTMYCLPVYPFSESADRSSCECVWTELNSEEIETIFVIP